MITSPAASARLSAKARKASGSISDTGLFQRVEIGDDIGAILRFGKASECHLGPLGKGLGTIEPLVQPLGIPLCTFVRLQRGRELIVWDLGDPLLGNLPEVRADLVLSALVEGVAHDADLGELLAALRIGVGKKRLDRLELRSRGLLGRCRRDLLGAGRKKDRLFERPWAHELASEDS